MGTNYSRQIAGAVNDFLEGDDWNFSFDRDKGMFTFNLTIKSKMKKVKYYIDIKDDRFVVYAVLPISADTDDPAMMREMAEFLHRANYGLLCGNFEFDFRDGEIRYKAFVDCDGIIPTKAMIRNSIYLTKLMFDRYAPGLEKIIFMGGRAKEAIQMCEK